MAEEFKICASHVGTSWKSDLFQIMRLGWPNSVNNLFVFLPSLAMLGFLGADADELAAAGMGAMFANVTGISLIVGFGSGAAPLISQAFGAQNYARCGRLLQRQLAIHMLLVVLVGAVWLHTEKILLLMHQPPRVAALTAQFVLWRLPALPFFAAREDVTNFLVAQQVMNCPMLISVLANACNVAIFPLAIQHLGFIGAPIAVTVTNVLQALLVAGMAPSIIPHEQAWPQWSLRTAFQGWGEMLKMALPAGVLMLSEWLGWETMLFFAGLLCTGEGGCAELDVFPIISNTMVIGFMVPYGFSIAAGTLVGNALGSGDHQKARLISMITLAFVASIGAVVAGALVSLRWQWGLMFSASPEIVHLTARVIPWVATYIFLDVLGPGALVSLLRGIGFVRLPAVINFLAFYACGIPVGLYLTFKEHWSIMGLWAGLDLAMFTMVSSLLTYLGGCMQWVEAAHIAHTRALETPASKSNQVETQHLFGKPMSELEGTTDDRNDLVCRPHLDPSESSISGA